MPDIKANKFHAPQTREERKLAALKAQKSKEKVFKLVAKVISWETGSVDSIAVKAADKVTHQEWLQYKKHQIGIYGADNIEKARDKLAQTYKFIKENGGFE